MPPTSRVGGDYYAELVAKVGEHEAQVLFLAYHLHTKKPHESDAVCIAAARWMLPAIKGAAHAG